MRLALGLLLGVAAISFGSIFTRLADAPAPAIAAWRLTFAALPLLAFNALNPRAVGLAGGDARPLVFAGLALAVHFSTWIASLSLTSVASSVALVTMHPLWVAALSAIFLKERPRRATWVGMALSLGGTVAIAGADFAVSPQALLGDGLAVLGGMAAAVYLVIGRRLRARLSLTQYVGAVYSVAAVALVLMALGMDTPLTGFSPNTWAALVAMAVVPQLLGHSLLNWALKHTSATAVSTAVLGEAVFATALAVPLLGEWPGTVQLAGMVTVLAGVALAVRGESRAAPPGPGAVPARLD